MTIIEHVSSVICYHLILTVSHNTLEIVCTRVKWTIECKINFISYANVVREYTDYVYL